VVALVGQGLGDSLSHDLVEGWLVRITKLFVEAADDAFRVLDQFVVSKNQVAGGRMRVQEFEGVFVPVPRKVQDFIDVEVSLARFGELASGVIDPRNGGWQHVQRIAHQIDDARIREEFGQRFDLGAESRVLGNEVFCASGVQVPLQHGLVETHNTLFVLGGERFVEVLVVWQLVHERKQETDEETVPVLQVDVLVLFGLEK